MKLSKPVSTDRFAYRRVALQRGACWYCDQPLGAKYTSVESVTGFPLFVHFHCQPDAEAITWPGRWALDRSSDAAREGNAEMQERRGEDEGDCVSHPWAAAETTDSLETRP